MSLHSNLSGTDLHDPKGKYPTALPLDDDTANAYLIEDVDGNDYLAISTSNGTEVCTIGNTTTNPKLTLEGTGLFTSGGGHKYNVTNVEDGTVPMLASSFVVLVDTSGGTTTYTLADPATVEGQVFYIIDKVANFATNNFTLTTDSPGELIDGSASDKVITESNARIWLFCDGTSWYTLLDDAATVPSDIVADTLKIDGDTLVANLPGYEDKVGVGTATPSQKLVVEDSAADPHLHVQKTGGNRVDLFATASKSGIQDVSGERISFTSGETVINGDAIDLDFRIKGDTDDNLFFANAGTDRIGIGTDDPQRQLHIGNGADSGEDAHIRLEGYSTSSAYHEIIADGDNLQFTRNTTQQLLLKYDGSVGIGVSNPSEKLEVDGTLKVSGIISGVATCVASTDAANKAYVDASGGGGLAAVVDDTSPQLGGNLDCNGNLIIFDTDTGIIDENGQEQITFLTTSSAINYLAVTNAAAGGNATAATSTAPIITGGGTTTNCDLALQGQGTGTVTVRSRGTNSGTLSLNNEANTYAVNITVPLVDELSADYTLTLPVDDGSSGQVMESDGNGVLSWVTPSAGGGGYTVSGISADPAPAVVDYYYVIDSSGGAVSIALPNAGATTSGKTIGFKARHGATYAVTLNRAAGGNIDGISSNLVLSTDMAAVELICDGVDWWIKS